ncbi:MAG: DUF2309 family protein, partial [Planctomycetales bacterium]|nr:DUF2309 family protein [Planctomycetales bacterium]
EIHEPMRLLFVIESTPDVMMSVMERNPSIAQLCHGDWVQVATLDPESAELHVFRNGHFEHYQPRSHHLNEVKSSIDWYRGSRDNLAFARIRT